MNNDAGASLVEGVIALFFMTTALLATGPVLWNLGTRSLVDSIAYQGALCLRSRLTDNECKMYIKKRLRLFIPFLKKIEIQIFPCLSESGLRIQYSGGWQSLEWPGAQTTVCTQLSNWREHE